MATVAAALTAAVPPPGPLDDLIAGLGMASGMIDGFIEEYGILPVALGLVNDVFAGLSGLSTEMELTFVGLLASLMEDFGDTAAGFVPLSDGLRGAALMLGPPWMQCASRSPTISMQQSP